MIRELAENPNLHQPLVAGRKLHKDRGGRFALYLAPGHTVHDATVQRVRVDDGGIETLLADIRAMLAADGRAGAEWELGESCTPRGLVERLLEMGLERDPHEPVATGMALIGQPEWEIPAGVEARPVRDARELIAARRVQKDAFGDPRPVDTAQIEQEQTREGIDGSTFVALIDGQIVAAAYASFTPWGLILFGGATLGEARGRGAYRALVAARAEEAAARGTPALVVHAGKMSRPILERLGFTPISRIDRLLDTLGPGTPGP